MDKAISVIIPVIEDNTYLVRCLNMLQRQTVLPLDIIIAEQNVETKVACGANVFCLSDENTLIPVTVNKELEYVQNDFHDQIFDEERKIASNVNKAISLAKGEYVLFCNISSVLSPNALEVLCTSRKENQIGEITGLYFDGKEYQELNRNILLWGKLFPKKVLTESKLTKWNYLELVRWIDSMQKSCTTLLLQENAYLYEESYDEWIQRVFTVKLKDDVTKYQKIFLKRLKDEQDLFEDINTYDYVKVNVITSLMEQCISDPNVVIKLAEEYVLPIYDNRLNAKKNRKEILHEALCNFFKSVETDEKQYDIVLFFFGLNRRMCEIFKMYDFEVFEKIYQRWKQMGFKEI